LTLVVVGPYTSRPRGTQQRNYQQASSSHRIPPCQFDPRQAMDGLRQPHLAAAADAFDLRRVSRENCGKSYSSS
jgi:hypothetical protein